MTSQLHRPEPTLPEPTLPEPTLPEPTLPEPTLHAGLAIEDWTGDALFHEYTRAANPVGRTVPFVPIEYFSPALHEGADTGVIPLDVSSALEVSYPATSPGLLASFVVVKAGEQLSTAPEATSELFVVMKGSGTTELTGRDSTDPTSTETAVAWQQGDVFVIPGGGGAVHTADSDSTLYWVHDEPLLRYLGVTFKEAQLRPTLWPAARNAEELAKVAADPAAAKRNRVSVLLNNVEQPQTLTASHVLWAMIGLLPVGANQKPHRHQSVALDLILDCQPGCYSLVGRHLLEDGSIRDPQRVDWEPGCAFITPPGLWHSHHNESGAEAHLLPVQDAGLQAYLRTLDIRFS